MAGGRFERTVQRLLNGAAVAAEDGDWPEVRRLAARVLELDPGNPEATDFANVAERRAVEIRGSQRDLAGFGGRLAAHIIDVMLYSVTTIAVVASIAVIDPGGEDGRAWGWIALWVGGLVLFQWFMSAKGTSAGKGIVGVRIIRDDGAPPGTWSGLGRMAGAVLSGLPLGLGYLSAVWDSQSQTWHDKLASTYAVRTRQAARDAAPLPWFGKGDAVFGVFILAAIIQGCVMTLGPVFLPDIP